jgi:hypothetical protein
MYDNLEPTVIDEDLLRSAVEEQGQPKCKDTTFFCLLMATIN